MTARLQTRLRWDLASGSVPSLCDRAFPGKAVRNASQSEAITWRSLQLHHLFVRVIVGNRVQGEYSKPSSPVAY